MKNEQLLDSTFTTAFRALLMELCGEQVYLEFTYAGENSRLN